MASSPPIVHERWPIERIIPHGDNPTIHPQRQRKALVEIIERIGVADAILVNRTTNHCIDGHLRLEEAITAGVTEVDVVVAELTEQEERAALGTIDPIGRTRRATPDLQRRLLAKIPRPIASVQPVSAKELNEKFNAAEGPRATKQRTPRAESHSKPRKQVVAVSFNVGDDRDTLLTFFETLAPDLGAANGDRFAGFLTTVEGSW